MNLYESNLFMDRTIKTAMLGLHVRSIFKYLNCLLLVLGLNLVLQKSNYEVYLTFISLFYSVMLALRLVCFSFIAIRWE